MIPIPIAVRIERMLHDAYDKDRAIEVIAQALDKLAEPSDTRDELTVDRAPSFHLPRLYPDSRPVAYGRDMADLVLGLYELVRRRALPPERLDIASIRFELWNSPALDGAPVFRARARLNPPQETQTP